MISARDKSRNLTTLKWDGIDKHGIKNKTKQKQKIRKRILDHRNLVSEGPFKIF